MACFLLPNSKSVVAGEQQLADAPGVVGLYTFRPDALLLANRVCSCAHSVPSPATSSSRVAGQRLLAAAGGKQVAAAGARLEPLQINGGPPT